MNSGDKIDWSITSIKHWQDGTWDALVRIASSNGRNNFDRCLSEDGFNWKNKYGRKVLPEIQDELTKCIGDMTDIGATTVVF